MAEAIADQQPLSGMDAIAHLEKMASAPPPKSEMDEAVEFERIEKLEFQPLPVDLPAGWRLAEWRQRHMVAIYEAGPLRSALDDKYDNRWRRNGDVVKSVLEHGGFDVKGIEPDDVDGMDWRDVEQIFVAVINHYQNTVLIKKK